MEKISVRKLASILCKAEGLKKQVSVGNMREILSLLSDLLFDDLGTEGQHRTGVLYALWDNGRKRVNKKNKVKK